VPLLTFTFAFTSCSDFLGPKIAVVQLTPTNIVFDAIGDTARLTAVARDSKGKALKPKAPVVWSSSNTAVARVEGGLVTALGNGSATITAMIDDVLGTASVVVTQGVWRIDVTPATDTIAALGATTQYEAQAWDRNGNVVQVDSIRWVSSNPAVATIDEHGLATAVSNGSVAVTASVGAVHGQAALIVRQRPATIVVAPTEAALLVNETMRLIAESRDSLNHAIPDSLAAVIWTSDSPTVAQVIQGGGVRAVKAGTARITATAGSAYGSALITVREPAPPPVSTMVTQVAVQVPALVDTAMVYVFSALGGASARNASGSYEVRRADSSSSAIFAMEGGEVFGLTVLPPAALGSAREPTRGRAADVTSMGPVPIDAFSTAVALVFFTPFFASAPAGVADSLLLVIRSVPEVAALADVINAHLAATGSLPDTTDQAFRAAYEAAVRAAHARIAQLGGFPTTEAMLGAYYQTRFAASGLEINLPANIAPRMLVEVRNKGARDVEMYLTVGDTSGRPREDLSTAGYQPLGGEAWLTPADYAPDITTLSGWLQLIAAVRRLASDESWASVDVDSITVSFTPDSARYLLYGYGLGLRDLGVDLGAISGDENWRYIAPALATVWFQLIAPPLSLVTGYKLKRGKPKDDPKMRALLSTIWELGSASGFVDCIPKAEADAVKMLTCGAHEIWLHYRRHPEALLHHLVAALDAAGVSATEDAISFILTKASLWLFGAKVLSTAVMSTAVDLMATTATAAMSQLRQEFDLSYNGLLGAARIVKLRGDRQSGEFGRVLPEPLEVSVTAANGAPVPRAWVSWAPAPGSGAASSATSVTDDAGRAWVLWTTGEAASQRVIASLTGTGVYVVFTFGVSATIGSFDGTSRTLPPNQDGLIRFSVTNTGTKAWTFGATVRLQMPSGGDTLLAVRTLTLTPDDSGTVEWTYRFNEVGSWGLRAMVWLESSEPLQTMLHDSGWLRNYIRVGNEGVLASTLRNVSGTDAPAAGVRQVLYTNPPRTVTGANPAVFADVSPGSYWLEGYYTGTFFGEEFWTSQMVAVMAGATTNVTLTRNYPYAADVVIKNDATGAVLTAGQVIPLGTRLRAEVTVRNNVPGTDLPSRVRFIFDRDRAATYDSDSTAMVQTVLGSGGTKIYTFRYTPSAGGQYYYALEVNTTLVNGNTVRTDSWTWTQTITVATTGTVSSTLRNVSGTDAPAAGVRQVLYTNPPRTVTGANPAVFADVSPGSYWLEGYYTGTFFGEEFWTSQMVAVMAGATTNVTLTRNYPYAADVVIKNDATGAVLTAGQVIPLGTRLRAEVTVRNNVPGTDLPSRVRFIFDRDRAATYDSDSTAMVQTVLGSGGTKIYTFRYTPSAGGQYYYALEVNTTLVNGNTVRTDSWTWTQTVRAQ